MSKRDYEWSVGRRQGERLSASQVQVIEAGFYAKRPARAVAREIGCAPRSVMRRYAALRDAPRPRSAVQQAKPSRFYTSTFEL